MDKSFHSLSLGRRALLLGGAAILSSRAVAAPARQKATRISDLPGLSAKAEILEDQRGISHVRAETAEDAFFANGYLVARDRLWQLDFGHRQALGKLAEVFGADFVPSDTANRLFLFQGNAEAEIARYSSKVQGCARSYVAGINAFIRQSRNSQEMLPEEFRIFDYEPLEWELEDLVRIRSEARGNTKLEIRRARLAARGAEQYDQFITPLDPPRPLVPLPGLDVAAVSDADLGLFGVLQARLPLGNVSAATLHGDPDHRRLNEGSNAWVVAPQRTVTGRPILANDPHLGFGVPGPRHVIHMTAPGLDVIGGGSPGMPGVMQGHNADIAFARTNFYIDQEDLFILRTHPHDPSQYFHHGEWIRMEEKETLIGVRGENTPRSVKLRFAAQGPVVSADSGKNRAVSVAASWLYPGANGLLANIGINLAHDWESFRAALRVHTSPTNFTYADIRGNIGWQAAGGLPLRANGHDGLMPAPGDGQYDWKGLQPLENLPSSFNPERGWFGTSNQKNLPADYPQDERRVSYEWNDAFRYERVAQVLDSNAHASLEDSVALQHDTFSTLALQVVSLLPQSAPANLQRYIQMLREWNGRIDASSSAAALYEVWWTRLERALHGAVIPSALHDLLPGPLSATVQLALLQSPVGHLGDASEQKRDAMLLDCLEAAVVELRERLGPLPAAWKWGTLHTLTLRHSLEHDKRIAAAFPVVGGASYGNGGDHYTVMARWYDPHHSIDNPYATTGGASYLMVCDVGAWDRSLFLNFPGQSGSAQSAHYQDFLKPWIAGNMQPFLFSAEAVETSAVRRIVMLP